MPSKSTTINSDSPGKSPNRKATFTPGELSSAPFSNQQEFERYAQQMRREGFTHVPIVQETLADLDTPVSTYLKLANKDYSYLFESVQGGEEWGRYSIIGLPCSTIYQFSDKQMTVQEGLEVKSVAQVDDPFAEIRKLQAAYRVASYPGLPEMTGGLVGYFGYEIIGMLEAKLAAQNKPDPLDCPDILLMVSEEVLVFDNLLGRIFMVVVADISQVDAYQQAQTKLSNNLEQLATSNLENPRPCGPLDSHQQDYQVHFDQGKFEAAVERCKRYIRDGDIMQVVLSQRLSTPFGGRSIDVYRALRTINPSPYMYFLNLGDFDIVGSSPEILVRVQDDTVTVRPIAGTRKRGATVEQDQALEEELLNDEKELAEHLMLIDLGRNDVGRIAEIGSVKLTEKMTVERYSHVMHIVSNVEARKVKTFDAIDVLKATFPAGTVSGAPKIRAMEIIAELEPMKRGIYSGAIGYLAWNGNMDTAIAIRTAIIKDGVLNIQAGAGIVADSVPEYEWKETMSKARVMFKAVEMASTGLRVGLNPRPSTSSTKGK